MFERVSTRGLCWRLSTNQQHHRALWLVEALQFLMPLVPVPRDSRVCIFSTHSMPLTRDLVLSNRETMFVWPVGSANSSSYRCSYMSLLLCIISKATEEMPEVNVRIARETAMTLLPSSIISAMLVASAHHLITLVPRVGIQVSTWPYARYPFSFP